MFSTINKYWSGSFSTEARDKGYGTFYEEALRIFTSLQELENVADPIAVTQVSGWMNE